MDEDEENIEPLPPNQSPRSRKRKSEATISPPPKTKKPAKPKHRIIVHEKPTTLVEEAYTQPGSDIPSSQPWRLRGAIWHRPAAPKPAPTPAVVDPFVEPHQTNGMHLLQQDTAQEYERGTHVPNDTTEDNLATATAAINDDTLYGSDDLFDQNGMSIEHEASQEYSNPPLVQPIDRDKASTLPPVLSRPPTAQDNSFDVNDELADLPSDAFASSSSSPQKSPQKNTDVLVISSQTTPAKRKVLAAPQQGLRQMSLFGKPAQNITESSQATKRLNFQVTQRNEPPTHHTLDDEAIKTWVYPTNLGTIRDYQYNIVARGLFHNLLVALPTGLGKTFIAATIMLNWFRWTKSAQIVFVAPTKPLVSQQVEACFGIAGIPRSETTMLTGGISPGLRAEEWTNKRVFFMTPQTLVNDLKNGYCDAKKIVLVVIDEAHRATGAYAYVEIIKFMRRFNQSFRILALTATPGNSVDTVQEVINGLDIARVEIRTEFSLDIRQYIHSKSTDRQVFNNSEEMIMVMDLFSKAVQPVLNKLSQFNAYWSKDPMALTPFGLTQARQKWMGSDAGRNATFPVKGMVNRIFTVLASLAHGVELLKYHGIGPFFHTMVNFRNAQAVNQNGRYEREIIDSEHFSKMMTRLQFWMSNETFIGHPKLEYLQGKVLEHFSNVSENSTTRIMIFAHYRDSAEEIVRVLNRNAPLIRPHVFVGQAASKGSEGMDQKKQLEVIQQFKEGKYNTLVATSIGEEGLDIGEIDLIMCYDSSASPIRMLQRMGRTGRKRAGNIILLLMRGKEENSFIAAKDNYEKMQSMISEGKRFEFHEDKSPRILPRNVQPVVDKRIVEIPVENSQAALPEPTRKGRRAPKRPPKKFQMPDNVRTGFVRASRLDGDSDDEEDNAHTTSRRKKPGKQRKLPSSPEPDLAPIPTLSSVILTAPQQKQFERQYLNVTDGATDIEVGVPSVSKHPSHQRSLGPTKLVKHSRATVEAVQTIKAIRGIDEARIEHWRRTIESSSLDELCGPIRALDRAPMRPMAATTATAMGASKSAKPKANPRPNAASKAKPKPAPKQKTPAAPRARAPAARATKSKPAPRRGRIPDPPSSPPNGNGIDATEAPPSSPPATDPHYALPTQGIDLGSGDTSGDEGIDGIDADSELDGFVVEGSEDDGGDSGEEVGGLNSELGRDGDDDDGDGVGADARGAGEDDESNGDGDSDSDVPRLSQLIGARPGRDGRNGRTAPTTVGPAKRKRRAVAGSSDEDE